MPRTAIACAAVLLFSGCGVLDELALNDAGRTPDPAKVYLSGADQITATKHEMETYACLNGPIICDRRGAYYECSCQL